jgi:hypothetical protein
MRLERRAEEPKNGASAYLQKLAYASWQGGFSRCKPLARHSGIRELTQVGTREGTGEPAQSANSNLRRNHYGSQPGSAGGPRGAAAASPLRRDDAGDPRTFRRRAM